MKKSELRLAKLTPLDSFFDNKCLDKNDVIFGDLIKKMLIIDPNQRPLATELLKHEFLKLELDNPADFFDDDDFYPLSKNQFNLNDQ